LDSPVPYQVLARKYRPQTFADLIGQEAMVRTLRNAFAADRIAHAFILTGVRGVGKTSTARIIAKGLNCTGPDGAGGPTVEPCGACETCVAIAEGRHVDVLEMDAASRTGVGDIREIIDSVAYRAASARYKVYIIDEVHMLSTSAFNALLKTLEEPPAHVKFLFATTEIRKVPVTVLSRCQRFDLRRIEPEMMIAHLSGIAATEGVSLEPAALALLTRAAEGSVRDALSLMDQAIAHGGGTVSGEQVRAMLGIADRGRVLDLFETVMRGDARAALAELTAQYADGADPAAVLRDLAEVTHWISVVRISPEAADDPTVAPDERARGVDLAGRLGMRSLTRAWQMLLKALEEVATAPNAMAAAEMAVIRLTHVADLPAPEELVRRLSGAPPAAAPPAAAPAAAAPADADAPGGDARAAPGGGRGESDRGDSGGGATARLAGRGGVAVAQVAAAEPASRPVSRNVPREAPQAEAGPVALARYRSFEDVLALIAERRDLQLLVEVEAGVRLARYAPGRIEFEPAPDARPDLAARLAQRLGTWTGQRWGVSIVGSGGEASVAERRAAARDDLAAQARAHPLVQAVLAAFPGAVIRDIRPPGQAAPEDAADPGPGEDDLALEAWDPDDPFAEET
jgi:DNA polymerase III subunit gamma/tau